MRSSLWSVQHPFSFDSSFTMLTFINYLGYVKVRFHSFRSAPMPSLSVVACSVLVRLVPFRVVFFPCAARHAQTFCTFIKYSPQAWYNYKRQSTVGFSMFSIFLDFAGGAFSILQMVPYYGPCACACVLLQRSLAHMWWLYCLRNWLSLALLLRCWVCVYARFQIVDSINKEDWSELSGNLPKLLIGLLCMSFDCVFFVQHFGLYRHNNAKVAAAAAAAAAGSAAGTPGSSRRQPRGSVPQDTDKLLVSSGDDSLAPAVDGSGSVNRDDHGYAAVVTQE